MTWIVVLAVLLVIFLAFAWWTDRRHKGPRDPGKASPLDPSHLRDKAEFDSLWNAESPMRRPRKNSEPPPNY